VSFSKKLENSGSSKDKDNAATFAGDVSATNTISDHPENELLLRQLVYADKVLLNKLDLIKEEERAQKTEFIKGCVRKVNHETLIEETSYARVDLEKFLGELEAVRLARKRVEISSEEL